MPNDEPYFKLIKGTIKTSGTKTSAYTAPECRTKIGKETPFSISKEESFVVLFKNAEKSYIEWVYLDNSKSKRSEGSNPIRMPFSKAVDDWYYVYVDIDLVTKHSNGLCSRNSKRIYVNFSVRDNDGDERCDFSIWFKKTAGIDKKLENKAENVIQRRVKSETDDPPATQSSTNKRKKESLDNPSKDDDKRKKTKTNPDSAHSVNRNLLAPDVGSSSSSSSCSSSSCSDNIVFHGGCAELGCFSECDNSRNEQAFSSWRSFADHLLRDMYAKLRTKLGQVDEYTSAYCSGCPDPYFIGTVYSSQIMSSVNEASQDAIKQLFGELVKQSPKAQNKQ